MYASLGQTHPDKYFEDLLAEAPGAMNFTMFLTMFGEKLQGTDPEDVIKNAFGCFDEENIGEGEFTNYKFLSIIAYWPHIHPLLTFVNEFLSLGKKEIYISLKFLALPTGHCQSFSKCSFLCDSCQIRHLMKCPNWCRTWNICFLLIFS